MQIKFVTRSGTNTFTGSGYYYYRSDKLNANTWFNNRNGVAKAKLKQNQIGGRVGGPIVIPGLFDGHNKAFFFVNYEEVRQPSDTTRNRTILNPAAQAGNFTLPAAATINVLALAAAQRPARDGRSDDRASCCADIRSATGTTGSLATIDANLQRFTLQRAGRVDAPLSDRRASTTTSRSNHRASRSRYNYQKFTDSPDTLNNRDAQFPGFPVEAGQASVRLGLERRRALDARPNLVNEARVGYSGAPVTFFDELNAGMFSGTPSPTSRASSSTFRPSARR